MKARDRKHFGVRRSPVSGKVCWRYITRHVRSAAFARTRLREFLMDRYAGDEKQVKKAMSLITGPGLGEWEMFTTADKFDEWWNGQWTYVKKGGRWVLKRQKKGEKHKRAGATKNWEKAQAAKPRWNKQDDKKYQAWLASLGRV